MSDVDHDQEVTPNSTEEFYTFLRTMVESMESDVLKSQRGNKAAGVRLRKSLRSLKKTSGDFVKFTLNSWV